MLSGDEKFHLGTKIWGGGDKNHDGGEKNIVGGNTENAYMVFKSKKKDY